MKYRRQVLPSVVLPHDLIHGYYAKDEDTLNEVRRWLRRNGLPILFTFGYARGDEVVLMGEDGNIYLEWEKLPLKKDLLRWLGKEDIMLLRKARSEGWVRKRIHGELSRLPISKRMV